MKRALIMAGGGTKVAFQAGVLQVWLDEAGLQFDHADGASGGVFNLAMYCQGMSGTEIADNWRNNRPLRGVQPSLNPFVSLFRLDRFRRNSCSRTGASTGRRSAAPTARRPSTSTTSAPTTRRWSRPPAWTRTG